jgi:hypothetical protein
LVVKAIATCSFGVKDNWERTKTQKFCKVRGISKFSHIFCKGNETLFNFGDVYVGTSKEKTITLRNPSPVSANFKIKRVEKNNGDCFDFSVVSGTVEPGSEYDIKVLFFSIRLNTRPLQLR